MSGYYCMHRGWMDNAVFSDDPLTDREAWCWLIEHACWKESEHRIGSTVVKVRRGQYVTSLRKLGEAWKWNKNKVHRFLRVVQQANMIRVESATGNGTAESIITICNYEKYQSTRDSAGTANGTETGQRRDSKRDTKEEKKKVINNSAKADADASEDLRKRLFGPCLDWLAQRNGKDPSRYRALIGKWIRDFGDGAVLEAFIACWREQPLDPVPWIERSLQARNGERPPDGVDPLWWKYKLRGEPEGRGSIEAGRGPPRDRFAELGIGKDAFVRK